MENSETLLQGSSDQEKGAYLGAIASLATADRQATEDELEYLQALAEAAKLSQEQTEAVLSAATDISTQDVQGCLDILKNSELKYPFITDLIAFAKADKDYSEQEQQYIEKTAAYLGIQQNQFSALNNFAEQATNSQTTPEQVSSPNFLSSSGLKGQLESAGINGNSLLKGLIGIAGPMILSRMLSGGGRRRGGGMFGGGGGLGGMMGGGGLGSLIGMLSGGRGMGSLGGILGGVLGGGRRRGF